MGPAWGIWALPIALRKVAEAVPKGSHPGRQTQDSGAVATSRQGIMVLFSVSSANRNWGKWWSVRGSCRIRFISHGGLFWCCSLRMPLLHGNFLATDQCYEHILSLCDGMWVALEKHTLSLKRSLLAIQFPEIPHPYQVFSLTVMKTMYSTSVSG